MKLNEFFAKYPNVAIAFSGGVDSAYLLFAAKQYAKKVRAYYVKSAFQSQFELDDAKRLAEQLEIPLKIISLEVLADPEIAANSNERCYYCKKKIFSAILEAAQADGFSVLLDGTNASDDAADRPGMRALSELSVFSPLRLCGLTKADIRFLSRKADLFTWNKPAYACLATRIATGQAIDQRLLRRTEEAEQDLFSLGFSNFRVRTVGETAKIQITAQQIPLLIEHREKILRKLLGKYESVCLDLTMRQEDE